MFKSDRIKRCIAVGVTAFLVIAAGIVLFFIIYRFNDVQNALNTLGEILTPITYGLVMAYLLNPVYNFFQGRLERLFTRRKGKKLSKRALRASKALSITITLILALVAVTSLLSMVIPQVIDSIFGIVESLPSNLARLSATLEEMLKSYPELDDTAMNLYNNLTAMLDQWIKNDLMPQLNSLVRTLSSGIFGAVNLLKNIVIGVIICVHVLSSKTIFCGQVKKMMYAVLPTQKANLLLDNVHYTHRVFGGYISGKLLDSLIVGLICFAFMATFNLPYAMLVSIVMGVTNIIPFFGPFIGAIPSILLIFLVDMRSAVIFAAFILVLQQIDGNIIEPKILGDSIGLSSFWVIVAIVVCGGLFGFVGMVIGAPAFAVGYSLVGMALDRSLRKHNLPIELDTYIDLDHMEEESGQPVAKKGD